MDQYVEIHGLLGRQALALTGKRGHVVGENASRRVGVELRFIGSGGQVIAKRKWFRPEMLLPVLPLTDEADHGSVRIVTRSAADPTAGPTDEGERACYIECCVADFVFSEQLDRPTNRGWSRLKLSDFLLHLFRQVMHSAKGLESTLDHRVRASQMFCCRCLIDGRPLSWESAVNVSAGEALPNGASPEQPHRIALHLDFAVGVRASAACGRQLDNCESHDRSDVTAATDRAAVCVAPISGKGLGVLAARDVRPGETLLDEAPLARLPFRYDCTQLRQCIAALSREARARFFELSHAVPRYGKLKEVYGVWQTNALPLGSGVEETPRPERPGSAADDTTSRAVGRERGVASLASDEGGIFPTIARVNHSCVPNARYEWDEGGGRMRLVAMDHVCEGGEITITYGADVSIDPRVSVASPVPLTREERRQRLWDKFGFVCTCAGCCEGDGDARAAAEGAPPSAQSRVDEDRGHEAAKAMKDPFDEAAEAIEDHCEAAGAMEESHGETAGAMEDPFAVPRAEEGDVDEDDDTDKESTAGTDSEDSGSDSNSDEPN